MSHPGDQGLPQRELEPEPEPRPGWMLDKGLQPSTLPPKPTHLFPSSDYQDEEDQEEEEKGEGTVGLSGRGRHGGRRPDSHSSRVMLGEPRLEEPAEDAHPPVSGPRSPLPTSFPEGPAPHPPTGRIWGLYRSGCYGERRRPQGF